MCCVVYLFTNVHIIHRLEVNAHVTGYVVGPMLILANVVQLGFVAYQIHQEHEEWQKQISQLKKMKAALLQYQSSLREVS